MTKHIRHKHHIIPKHAGGTDDATNLVDVSVEEHAELHFALYLTYGRWQDYRAALGLAGIIGKEEILYEMHAERAREMTRNRRSYKGEQNPFYGKTHSVETRNLLKQKTKETWENQPHPWIGKKHTEESKQKMRENNKGKGNPNFGKKHSEETLIKMKEARKLWWEKKRQQQSEA